MGISGNFLTSLKKVGKFKTYRFPLRQHRNESLSQSIHLSQIIPNESQQLEILDDKN